MFVKPLILAGMALLAGSCSSAPLGGHADEELPRNETLALLRAAGESEALYTLAGGLKPMSSGFWSGSIELAEPSIAELIEVREALAPLRNDTWYADVQVFDAAHDGKRFAQAYVVHRRAFATMLRRHQNFWSAWGITPNSHPAEVVAIVDRMPQADRWRGYGYFFGYPVDAVEFFIEANLAAQDGRSIGPGKDREFIQIPTLGSETGRFTYAVPIGHVKSKADLALAALAQEILLVYSEGVGGLESERSLLREFQRLNRRFESAAVEVASIRDAESHERVPGNGVLEPK